MRGGTIGPRALGFLAAGVIVVDIATGDALPVAKGREVIWLDDHTLLVKV